MKWRMSFCENGEHAVIIEFSASGIAQEVKFNGRILRERLSFLTSVRRKASMEINTLLKPIVYLVNIV